MVRSAGFIELFQIEPSSICSDRTVLSSHFILSGRVSPRTPQRRGILAWAVEMSGHVLGAREGEVEVERVPEEREVEVERRAEASLDDEDDLEGHLDIKAPDAETEVLGDGDAKDPDSPRMGCH
ncbi:hypothetical protein ACE6H2_026084 [Prunus campanulata]